MPLCPGSVRAVVCKLLTRWVLLNHLSLSIPHLLCHAGLAALHTVLLNHLPLNKPPLLRHAALAAPHMVQLEEELQVGC